jgi:DNA polymerase-1
MPKSASHGVASTEYRRIKAWQRKNSKRYMLLSARARAKKSGIPFDLTEDDFDIPVFCPALGLKLERAVTGKGANWNAPSLDRIKPELGYVKGNVIVVSYKANTMKNSGSADDLRKLAAFYTELEKQCQNTNDLNGPLNSVGSMGSPSPKRTKTPLSSPSLEKPNTATRMMNVALIDGDIVAYKASFGNEAMLDLGDGVINISADLPAAEETADHMIEAIKDKLSAKKIIVALSDRSRNFRKEIYSDYKATRDYRRKPVALAHLNSYLAKKYGVKIHDGLEADDVLGILCTHPKKFAGQKPIIVTIDKDLLQIPGRHYNPDKDLKRMVSLSDGDMQFYTQVLTGDSVDNFPGCPGIGPKRAAAILTGARPTPDMWPLVRAAYERAGKTEDDALVQARVARILRYADYNFKRKEPILWTP